MRRRLLLSTLAVAVAVVMVFAVPLGFVQAESIQRRAEDEVQSEAARIVRALDQLMLNGRPIGAATVRPLVTPGTYVVIESDDLASPIDIGEPFDISPMSIGRGQQPQSAADDVGQLPVGVVIRREDAYVTALPGRSGTTVTVMMPKGDVSKDIWRAWLTIAGAGGLAVAAAAGLALLLARRLSKPLIDLAQTAESLGNGDLRPRVRRYGIAELDQVADVLDDSAVRISRMLAAERQFAANASHQLRTPLTALSMRVEEMCHAADLAEVKDEADVALNQIERLTGVVEELLRGSGAGSASTVLHSVDAAIKQQINEWRPPYEHAGRRIDVNGRGGLVVLATPGRLAQSLAVLFENALVHGSGSVSVTTRAIGGKVIIQVGDEGQGVPADLAPRIFDRRISGCDRTGLGLALARQLVEADDGRLELTSYRPAIFSIFLPRGTVADRQRVGTAASPDGQRATKSSVG